MWEGRHLEFGFGTLATFERVASDFWESPLQVGCSGQGLGRGRRMGRLRMESATPAGRA